MKEVQKRDKPTFSIKELIKESSSSSLSPDCEHPWEGRVNYSQLLKDPRWQKKRLEIMQRDQFKCIKCNDNESELHVHHITYLKNLKPWEYPDSILVTLCNNCHHKVHNAKEDILVSIDGMDDHQLYFAIDIMTMLLLANKEECLKTLEFLTGELNKRYHV